MDSQSVAGVTFLTNKLLGKTPNNFLWDRFVNPCIYLILTKHSYKLFVRQLILPRHTVIVCENRVLSRIYLHTRVT